MSGPPGEWDYLYPSDECANRIEATPVPNRVVCGICGTEMIVYAIESHQ